jgi:ABC-type multidrug transport system ATPase subunit
VCTSSYLSVEMLKLVDKVIYLHEGETVYFGRPFKTHSFLSRVLGTNLKSESNPICTLSNLFNSRIERKGELKDYQNNKKVVTAASLSSFNKKHFLGELKDASELPNPNKKFRENFFKCFFILAKRIILFTIRDRFALLYYIILIIVLGGFGCILFEKLDGEYIETGGTA